MPLTISPVLSSDLEDVHRFQLSVDAQGPIGRLAFLNGANDVSVAGYVQRSRKCMSDPNSTLRRVIARDDGDTGEVVGYALWSFVRENQAGIETTDAGGVGGEWSGDVNKGLLEAWIGLRKRKREEVMGGKPHACMLIFLVLKSVRFLTYSDSDVPLQFFYRFASLEHKYSLTSQTSLLS